MRLESAGADRWRGDVEPRHDEFTLYLMVGKRADGTLGTYLRNPERNIGLFNNIDRLERSGDTVRLIGRGRGDKAESALFTGEYDRDNGILVDAFSEQRRDLRFPARLRCDSSGFYPRGRKPARSPTARRPQRDDGWPTATLDGGRHRSLRAGEVHTDDRRHADRIRAHTEVHGVLIARHGKLVLEEYFHGEHRDMLHETRSAAKSLTATLVGAAMQAGMPVALSTPVYATMFGGQPYRRTPGRGSAR